ncbi:TM2 domain-containing protein [Actinomyces glycerinitolerans]|uniref:TM2 domain-containing protein n=1 Tax=Actinomyces glycerinitolerans TaxID=1892869 RepID=A0A1M4S0Q2_9ACTO|nr:TM2 domain-containing protein [Actinomyces glycerinitolerans]SHE25768.1 Hypothetical protein ACGLYG10_2004 [Actinomyces glycerinitolerans]
MSQSPNNPGQPQPPAYGGGQPSNPYGQQAYSQQPAYAAPGYGAPAYGDPYGQGGYVEPKSKVAAAVLAFFLGTLGIHNFYRGQTRNGIIHLCLVGAAIVLFIIGGVVLGTNVDAYGNVSDGAASTAGMLMLLGWLVAAGNGIWAFVEFIMILVSNDGSLR